MPSNLSWMLNEKILLLECEGQIETSNLHHTHAKIKHMVAETVDQQAYLLVDMSNSESNDYEYTLLSQLDSTQIKAVILISASNRDLKPLSQRIKQDSPHRNPPQILLGTDREIAFNYLTQIVDRRSIPA